MGSIHRNFRVQPAEPNFDRENQPAPSTRWDLMPTHLMTKKTWNILKLGQNPHIWVNYNDLTATTGIMVSKENHPQMALIQVSEIL